MSECRDELIDGRHHAMIVFEDKSAGSLVFPQYDNTMESIRHTARMRILDELRHNYALFISWHARTRE